MAADDFIDLDANSDSDRKMEDDNLLNSNSSPSEADCETSTFQMKDVIPNGENTDTSERNDISEEDKHMETIDLEVDLMQTNLLRENLELVESVMMAGKVNEVEVGQERDDGCTVTQTNSTIDKLLVDASPILGVKRARVELVDQQPSVRVVYSSLTRESKKKLMELMQQWSEWHAQCQSPSKESSREDMESGEETYFPALRVGLENSSTVSFWLDNQSRKEDTEYKSNNDLVPLYDRGCMLGSSIPDGSANYERFGTLEASRCFNCGSYNHSLKECSKRRDHVAISNARKQQNSKRNQTSGSRTAIRYYQKSSGKFDDLIAGILGPETRESLGIGEFDPPPWLHRMRELGYPPGYLDTVEDEDQPSGITIYGDEETIEYEEGELPEKAEPEPPRKKMCVEFPGINAPIPENADPKLWASARSDFSGPDSYMNRLSSRFSRASDPQRGAYPDQRWSAEHRDDGPGMEYSSRYSPYDRDAASRSLTRDRSLSDRGWRSPLPYESSPGHSPYPYSTQSQESSHHYSPEHRSHEKPNSTNPDSSSKQSRDRRDHRRHHRR